jgi:hypothetical protein
METVVLLSCVKKKLDVPAIAKEIYISDFFQKAFEYAESLRPGKIFILSAKYQLLSPERMIEPYELTLNNMGVADRRKWANQVIEQLRCKADLKNDKFIFLAGQKYREFLVPAINNYEVPMQGLQIGKQLGWLKRKIENGNM